MDELIYWEIPKNAIRLNLPPTYLWFWKRYFLLFFPFMALFVTILVMGVVVTGNYDKSINVFFSNMSFKAGLFLYFFLAKITVDSYYLPNSVFFSGQGVTLIGNGDCYIPYPDIESWGFEDWNDVTGCPAIHLKLQKNYLVLGLADYIEPDKLLAFMNQKVPVD